MLLLADDDGVATPDDDDDDENNRMAKEKEERKGREGMFSRKGEKEIVARFQKYQIDSNPVNVTMNIAEEVRTFQLQDHSSMECNIVNSTF